MGQLLGPETFEFLARFFLAGWLFLSVRSWWVRGERPRPNEVLFEAITLSLLNQLVALITLPLLSDETDGGNNLLRLLTEVLFQPLAFGILVGWLAERNSLPDGLRRLLMPSTTPVSDAFDFAFAQIKNESFLILRFNDGRAIYGFFGKNSFASNDGEGSGVFLEALFVLGDDEKWIGAEPPRSAWINLDGLASIEMISEEEVENG